MNEPYIEIEKITFQLVFAVFKAWVQGNKLQINGAQINLLTNPTIERI